MREITPEEFSSILYGIVEDPEIEDAILGFDRAYLAASWSVDGHKPSRSFGDVEEHSPSDQSRQALRDALSRVAERTDRYKPQRQIRWGEDLDLYMVDLDGSGSSLEMALGITNQMLLSRSDRSIRASWTVYGDRGSERIYQLDSTSSDPSTKQWAAEELLIRVGANGNQRRARTEEAALQQFLLSWNRIVSITCEPLRNGYQRLWQMLKLPERSIQREESLSNEEVAAF